MSNFDLRIRARKQFEDILEQPAPYTSNYFEDLTKEKEFIHSAFEANNYINIRDLPNNL